MNDWSSKKNSIRCTMTGGKPNISRSSGESLNMTPDYRNVFNLLTEFGRKTESNYVVYVTQEYNGLVVVDIYSTVDGRFLTLVEATNLGEHYGLEVNTANPPNNFTTPTAMDDIGTTPKHIEETEPPKKDVPFTSPAVYKKDKKSRFGGKN
jgi:hypothetical protein